MLVRMEGKNTTILLSRKTAHQIGRYCASLPSNCTMDGIYDQENHTLWILDVLKWKDQAMIDCEASFRFWWRDAKLSELTPQLVPDSTTLLCVPIPASSPFSKAQVYKTTAQMMSSSSVVQEISVLPNSSGNTSFLHQVTYQAEGLLFYLKSATYECGESVLAGWIPLHELHEAPGESGISRLNWLCDSGDKMDE